jgi:hypothetical protein
MNGTRELIWIGSQQCRITGSSGTSSFVRKKKIPASHQKITKNSILSLATE